MAGVALFDLDDGKETIGGRIEPNATNIGDAGIFERVPNQCRALDRTVKSLIGRRAQRRLTAEDWIISIVQSFNADHRLVPGIARIVTRPFAERALGQIVARKHFSFDGYFRKGRDRQSSVRTAHDLNRLVQNSARVSKFTHLEDRKSVV